MCVEVYSTTSRLTVKYNYETVRFNESRSFTASFILLIENAGTEPLEEVFLVYPKSLLEVKTKGSLRHAGMRIGNTGPGLLREVQSGSQKNMVFQKDMMFYDSASKRMRWKQPDPNDPASIIQDLEGVLDPTNTLFTQPAGITPSHVELINKCGLSAWSIKFVAPLKPEDRHWITFKVSVKNVGGGIARMPLGSLVYHRLASPLSVWRLFSEKLLAARSRIYNEEGEVDEDIDQIRLCDAIINIYGLSAKQRNVRMEHYLLEVNPGRVAERALLAASAYGDLWPRSASPMLVSGPRESDDQELAFLWKSGVKLDQFKASEPEEPPRRDIDFMLMLSLLDHNIMPARILAFDNDRICDECGSDLSRISNADVGNS